MGMDALEGCAKDTSFLLSQVGKKGITSPFLMSEWAVCWQRGNTTKMMAVFISSHLTTCKLLIQALWGMHSVKPTAFGTAVCCWCLGNTQCKHSDDQAECGVSWGLWHCPLQEELSGDVACPVANPRWVVLPDRELCIAAVRSPSQANGLLV